MLRSLKEAKRIATYLLIIMLIVGIPSLRLIVGTWADGSDYQGTLVRDFTQSNNGSVWFIGIGQRKTPDLYDKYKSGSIIYVTNANGDTYILTQGRDYTIENDRAVFISSNRTNAIITALIGGKNIIPEVNTMLAYIVQKNNGSISWNADKTILSVDINGYTKEYDNDSLTIHNGRVIMSAKKIAEDFKLMGTNTFHTMYDSFESMDDAARAFSYTYRQKSFDDYDNNNKRSGREYMAFIYNDSDKFLFGEVTKGTYRLSTVPPLDQTYTTVAWIHTHGAFTGEGTSKYSNQQVFTGYSGDASFAKKWYDWNNSIRYAYLITNNNGKLKRLDASTIEFLPSDHYIWDSANRGPHGQYNTSVDIIMEGLK